jgi:fimbrial isopeptide formation D2 family protein
MENGRKVVRSLALALITLLLLAPVVAAQEEPPDTAKPPSINKIADETGLLLGDSVRFTIVVINPSGPDSDGTWMNVRVTDNIDRALHIDAADSTKGTVTIDGQTVVVDGGITLAPGDQFVITIDCTLIGPADAGEVLTNTARLEYTDSEGTPQPPVDAEEPVKIVVEEQIPPVVPEASSLLLVGSAVCGLAGYASLQLLSRRRHGNRS